jgi:hypothetical protein
MPARQVPFRPHLDQLRNQAKDLLRDVRAGTARVGRAPARRYHLFFGTTTWTCLLELPPPESVAVIVIV